MTRTPERSEFQYDVCLSFAGEQRTFVERVAASLRRKGTRVFFDEYETTELWGKDLYAHLDEVYTQSARYCILFASKAYAEKVWTNHERRSAQARALRANREYILPARFDDTPIPGLPETVHYLDLRRLTPAQVARHALAKIGAGVRKEYLPPVLDKLFRRLRIRHDKEAQEQAHQLAHAFFGVLRRMSPEECTAVLKTILFGCPAELPDNVHINVDLLRRLTGKTPARLKRVLGGLRSLGFTARVRTDTGDHGHAAPELGSSEVFELEWVSLSDDEGTYPPMLVVREMVVGATDAYCEEHAWPFLERLDFSQLAAATATRESHRPKGKARAAGPRRERSVARVR